MSRPCALATNVFELDISSRSTSLRSASRAAGGTGASGAGTASPGPTAPVRPATPRAVVPLLTCGRCWADIPNAPHQDHNGGELKQDFFLMVCAEAPELGGESFMLDGYGLLEGMPDGLGEAMFRVPTAHGGVARSPNAQWTKDGRLHLRVPNGGHSGNRASADVCRPCASHEEQGRRIIDRWREGVVRAAPHAPRFRVAPGEVLVIDNCELAPSRPAPRAPCMTAPPLRLAAFPP